MTFTLADLLTALRPYALAVEGDLSVQVLGVGQDSRTVGAGWVFVARAGLAQDGTRFVSEAVARGAAAILSEHDPVDEARGMPWVKVRDVRHAAAALAAAFHREPGRAMAVDFVTGTNGKTSSTYLMEGVLREAGLSAGVMGTIVRRFAGREVESSMTTPDAPEMQAVLAEMRDAGVERVAMELSSHAIDQDRWFPIPFRVGLLTNVTRDHIDYHGTFEAYARTKREAFTRVLAGSPLCEGAVFNLDDEVARGVAAGWQGRAVTFGLKVAGSLEVVKLETGLFGSRLTLEHQGVTFQVATPLIGLHNVSNVLGVVGYGLLLGLDPQVIARGVEGVKRVPGRLDPLLRDGRAQVLVDYAHTPDALENVLKAVRAVTSDRIVTVFGAGGDRDRGKRPLMGEVVRRLSDVAIVTSDNPRSEDPQAILSEILGGMAPLQGVIVEPDRREAIRRGVAMLDGRTLLLIAGKGHENYQLIGNTKSHFDDREVAAAFLCLEDAR
jgi:UDP-N-acetylmuramoyl-L-alanyl-D-glutamate--2,6-diaminopimelate ligase